MKKDVTDIVAGEQRQPCIAVVIPCFRVRSHILSVLARIGDTVSRIYIVDDACPEGSGALVSEQCSDPRVSVIKHAENRGVGGAVVTGYRAALAGGADIVVKLDGDGQMDPALIPGLVQPLIDQHADYVKGNRFFNPDDVRDMPGIRLFGNAVLSFMAKLSSGYWDIFDPTNGFTAIASPVLAALPLDRISERYFFESDMLFRLGVLRAVVADFPMQARYGDERSNLQIRRILGSFLRGHVRNTLKRFFYNYLLRGFSIATVQVGMGLPLLFGGSLFGLWQWHSHALQNMPASSGTVMLAALPIVIGAQLLLSALNYDIQSVPQHPLHPMLARGTVRR